MFALTGIGRQPVLNLHNDRYGIPFVVLDQDRLPIVYGFQFNFQCLQINNSGTILQSTKYLGETFDDPLLVGMRYASPNSICYLLFPSHPFPNYTQQLLHTQMLFHRGASAQRPFYNHTALHKEALAHSERSLPIEGFTKRSGYTEQLLHTNAFTHRSF